MTTNKEAFEAWMRKEHPLVPILKYDGEMAGVNFGNYVYEETKLYFEGWQACDAHWREKLQEEYSGLTRNPHCGQPVAENDVLIDWDDFCKLKNAEKQLIAMREKLQSDEMVRVVRLEILEAFVDNDVSWCASAAKGALAAISKETGV